MNFEVLFREKLMAAVLIAGGLSAGIVNGLIGTGGGIVITLSLSIMLSDTVHSSKDVLTSAMAAILPISVFSVLTYRSEVLTDPSFFFPTVVSAALGGLTGAIVGTHVKAVLLEKIFSVLVIWSGIRMIAGR